MSGALFGQQIKPRNVLQFRVDGAPRPWQRTKTRVVFAKSSGKPFVHTYSSEKTVEAEALFAARAVAFKPAHPLPGPIRLELLFVMPIPKSMSAKLRARIMYEQVPHVVKPDLDNLEKMVKDSLTGIFWLDDSQVYDVDKRKVYGTEPRTEVRITEW